MTETIGQELPHCSLTRRLAAIFYDTLLLIAVLVAASFPPVLLFTSGEQTPPAWAPLFRSYLLTVSFLFYGWFWTHGGQTLGMRVWRVRVQTRKGHGITWWQALLRFIVAIVSWACLGLGFLWSLFDK
ncbi:MAG: RDD family protein, partial [Gammaproteobacteria bacterium]|nr:RDD family protein [Gammaproteobacteria bacterium]